MRFYARVIFDSIIHNERTQRILSESGRLELAARGHSNSGTVAGTFQIYVENTFISPCICLAALNKCVVHLHLHLHLHLP